MFGDFSSSHNHRFSEKWGVSLIGSLHSPKLYNLAPVRRPSQKQTHFPTLFWIYSHIILSTWKSSHGSHRRNEAMKRGFTADAKQQSARTIRKKTHQKDPLLQNGRDFMNIHQDQNMKHELHARSRKSTQFFFVYHGVMSGGKQTFATKRWAPTNYK